MKQYEWWKYQKSKYDVVGTFTVDYSWVLLNHITANRRGGVKEFICISNILHEHACKD